jgi:hypothetical protein
MKGDLKVDRALLALMGYIHHIPTCAADDLIGKGCNCGLREKVAEVLK